MPPEKIHEAYRVAQPEPRPSPKRRPEGPQRPSAATADLSRLSIDDDGRLYWDGKPVEVRRRIRDVAGPGGRRQRRCGFRGVIGALGAAVIQGSLALRDWACRLGWTTSYCAPPGPGTAAPPGYPGLKPRFPGFAGFEPVSASPDQWLNGP